MQIIGGHSRFETFANYALRNGPVAAGRIAPESSNFQSSKPSPSSLNERKIFDERVKVRRQQRNRKNTILLQKNIQFFSFLEEAMAVKISY